MIRNPWAWVPELIDKTRHPVGYIFEFDPTGLSNAPDLTTPDKVAEYFGYGVWEAYGGGRVTVGVVNGKYAAGATGGEEKHSLTIDELAQHEHNFNRPNWYTSDANGSANIIGTDTGRTKVYTGKTEKAGGGQPHNNMQPYIVVYRWRRVA